MHEKERCMHRTLNVVGVAAADINGDGEVGGAYLAYIPGLWGGTCP